MNNLQEFKLASPEQRGAPESLGGTKIHQVFVRLDRYHFEELGRLANERNWYRGTYLAKLFCAHAAQRPVLCDAEINAVRHVTRQLSDIGRSINQIALKLNASRAHSRHAVSADLEIVRVLVESEVAAMRDLMRANLRGWGVQNDQA